MMQEDSSQNAQSRRLEEPQHTPQWTDQAEGEGPIEASGDPTQADPNPILPPPK